MWWVRCTEDGRWVPYAHEGGAWPAGADMLLSESDPNEPSEQ